MDFIDRQYISRAAGYLERFRERGNDFNFRCPFCGDSSKDSDKARGWIRQRRDTNKYWYSCYNCSCVKTLHELFVKISPTLGEAYAADKFKASGSRPVVEDRAFKAAVTAKPVFAVREEPLPVLVPDPPVTAVSVVAEPPSRHPLRSFPGVTTVWDSEWALEYLASRRIPIQALDHMFVADPLTEVSGRLEAYKTLRFHRMKGIIFPYYGIDGSIEYLQARTTSEDLRYMTFEVNGGGKLWGRHRVDPSKRIFMFEGVLDAVMTANGMASGGVDLIRAGKIVKEEYPDTPLALVYDSDWHSNEQVYWQVVRAVEQGFDVVFAEGPGKDVNEMVKDGGWTCEDVDAMLVSSVKTGMAATLAIASVRKPWGKKKKAAQPLRTEFATLTPRR